jgi:hypothetical protein
MGFAATSRQASILRRVKANRPGVSYKVGKWAALEVDFAKTPPEDKGLAGKVRKQAQAGKNSATASLI